SLTSLKPDHTVNPDEAVARGAAIFAGYVIRRRDPNAKPTFKVVDVNAHSLGIEGIDQRTMRKENIIIISRNTPLPAKVTQKFVTKVEDQISIVVQVLEGESKIPSQCSAIGRAVLRNLPEHLPKGWPVEVTYEFLTNGRHDVRAKLPGTSRGVQLELQREQTLTSERIGKWKKVLAAAQGFDAFEGMLDEVMYAHKLDRKAAQKTAATIPAGAAAAEPIVSEAELSAASQAFAEVQAEIGGAGGSDSTTRAAAKSAENGTTASLADEKIESRRGTPPSSSTARETAARPVAKAAAPIRARPTNAAAAARGSLIDQAAAISEPSERSRKRGIPPFVMWLMTIVAMLIVSLVALAVFYYLIANFTKMGDFLHLKLPGLPPPKAQQTALSEPTSIARSGVRENSDAIPEPPYLNSHEFSYESLDTSSFVLRHSLDIRHSSFDIQGQA
ncbi:MAG TPA: Hsp70 family protein, partial [Pirellulales bacterium]